MSRATVTIRCSGTDGTDSSGSGFLVAAEGVVVTNYHVVHGCQRLQVRLSTGDVFEVVRVHGLDPGKDIAIVRVPGFKLPTVPLGDSDSVRKGDSVLVLGSPLGILEGSVSRGVVSAIRDLEGLRVFQMDAAVSQGNSGGPVVDDRGRVVGVTSFKLTSGESLNFAIPINYVRGLLAVDQLLGLESLVDEVQTSLFGDESGAMLPRRWRSLTSSKVFQTRVDGDYVYVETELTAEEKQLAFYSTWEFTKEGDEWKGTYRAGGRCQYGDGVWTTIRWNFCTFERQGAITLLTPTRIEGWAVGPQASAKFRCKRCAYDGPNARRQFVWVPME